jgi:antirestriction protein ArdC
MSFAIYEKVTNQIIAQLEAGTIPWTQPWKNQRTGRVMPQNAATGRPYSGINIPILWGAASAYGYPTHQWMSFKQALDLKACVRKGEKGTQVVFTKIIPRDEDDERGTISMLKTFYVFNVQQIEGLHIETLIESPIVVQSDIHGLADAFVAATKADIRIGGSKACFVPSLDFIAMPPRGAFDKLSSFYSVELHELGHWAGGEKRLNRDLNNRFGTRAYAAEELIAELTSAFLCAHLGIEGELRHASYLASWLELLRHDNRAIFTAASQASKAADHLRSYSETVEETA